MDIFVRLIADLLVIPVVLIGIYALIRYVPKSRRYQTYATVLMAGLTSYLVAKIIGLFFQPTNLRPFELLGVDAGASYLNNPGFPSDHTLFTMAIVLAVWFGAKNKKLALVALVLTLLIAIGRVLALVHTPLDVIGGIVIACVGAVWYFLPTKSLAVKK